MLRVWLMLECFSLIGTCFRNDLNSERRVEEWPKMGERKWSLWGCKRKEKEREKAAWKCLRHVSRISETLSVPFRAILKNDVRKIFGYLEPLPPRQCPIHTNYHYLYYCHYFPSVRKSNLYGPFSFSHPRLQCGNSLCDAQHGSPARRARSPLFAF